MIVSKCCVSIGVRSGVRSRITSFFRVGYPARQYASADARAHVNGCRMSFRGQVVAPCEDHERAIPSSGRRPVVRLGTREALFASTVGAGPEFGSGYWAHGQIFSCVVPRGGGHPNRRVPWRRHRLGLMSPRSQECGTNAARISADFPGCNVVCAGCAGGGHIRALIPSGACASALRRWSGDVNTSEARILALHASLGLPGDSPNARSRESLRRVRLHRCPRPTTATALMRRTCLQGDSVLSFSRQVALELLEVIDSARAVDARDVVADTVSPVGIHAPLPLLAPSRQHDVTGMSAGCPAPAASVPGLVLGGLRRLDASVIGRCGGSLPPDPLRSEDLVAKSPERMVPVQVGGEKREDKGEETGGIRATSWRIRATAYLLVHAPRTTDIHDAGEPGHTVRTQPCTNLSLAAVMARLHGVWVLSRRH